MSFILQLIVQCGTKIHFSSSSSSQTDALEHTDTSTKVDNETVCIHSPFAADVVESENESLSKWIQKVMMEADVVRNGQCDTSEVKKNLEIEEKISEPSATVGITKVDTVPVSIMHSEYDLENAAENNVGDVISLSDIDLHFDNDTESEIKSDFDDLENFIGNDDSNHSDNSGLNTCETGYETVGIEISSDDTKLDVDDASVQPEKSPAAEEMPSSIDEAAASSQSIKQDQMAEVILAFIDFKSYVPQPISRRLSVEKITTLPIIDEEVLEEAPPTANESPASQPITDELITAKVQSHDIKPSVPLSITDRDDEMTESVTGVETQASESVNAEERKQSQKSPSRLRKFFMRLFPCIYKRQTESDDH